MKQHTRTKFTLCNNYLKEFLKSKSILRSTLWLLSLLVLAGACLYGCIDRILFFGSKPVTTSMLINRMNSVEFPAVTICNLNYVTLDYLESKNITNYVTERLRYNKTLINGVCKEETNNPVPVPDLSFEGILVNGRHKRKDFFIECRFMGDDYDANNLEPYVSDAGLCYTFNSGNSKPILITNGTGIENSFRAFLNIEQDKYSMSSFLDTGAQVIIHDQSEPPLPSENSLKIPPGKVAFISISKSVTVDEIKSHCRSRNDTGFNFLENKFSYSKPACLLDCHYTQIADKCNCIYFPDQFPPDLEYGHLPPCKLKDICCVLTADIRSSYCNCVPSCTSIKYETTVTYSTLPALNFLERLSPLGDKYFFQNNIVGVSIFFNTLDVQSFTNSDAYTVTSLLSDFGGLLGLYLGICFMTIIDLILYFYDLLQEYRKKVKETEDSKAEGEKEPLMYN